MPTVKIKAIVETALNEQLLNKEVLLAILGQFDDEDNLIQKFYTPYSEEVEEEDHYIDKFYGTIIAIELSTAYELEMVIVVQAREEAIELLLGVDDGLIVR